MSINRFYGVLPYTRGPETVLLGRRHVIQTRVDGRQERGIIPEWAGQYVVIGGFPGTGGEAEQTAIRMFLGQTGIDLSTAAPQTGKRQLTLLQDNSFASFYILYLELTPDGLEDFNRQLETNIQNRTVYNGVLEEANIFQLPDALSSTGPVASPAGGWRAYLINNYFGGVQQGQFNSEIDILQSQITNRTQEQSEWFRIALRSIPA